MTHKAFRLTRKYLMIFSITLSALLVALLETTR